MNQHENTQEKKLSVALLQSQQYSELSKLRDKWTDDMFTPDDSSLFSGKTDWSKDQVEVPKFLKGESKQKFASQYSLKNNKKYDWKRLSDVYDAGEINILKEPKGIKQNPDILTEDIIQGSLGDCYFLSALSALAEFPQRIKLLIPNLNLTRSGVFEVIPYIHGIPTPMVIDDYFPFHAQKLGADGKPKIAFTSINPNSGNIWPMLLEKAWAKANLNYENIIAGNSSEAFEFLSPAPVDTFYHEVEKEFLYDYIRDADRKNYIICADVTLTKNTNIEFLSKMGLITNHAYTVIDIAEIFDTEGKKIRLLKIRNPWGSNEWNGDWSDHSRKWTEELKQKLAFEAKEDGTFWMAYEDFLKFYTSTHICRIYDGFGYISNKYSFMKDKAFNLVHVTVPKDTSGFFIANQKNARIYRNAKGVENFKNNFCSMVVFKKEDNENLVYIGATCGRKNRLYVECENMTRGDYYIALSFPNNLKDNVSQYDDLKGHSAHLDHETFTFRCGIYSPLSNIKLELESGEEDDLLKKFIKKVMYDLASKNPNIYHFEEEGEPESWRSISFEKEAGAYGYIVYQNNSDCYINEELTLSQYFNINLVPILTKGDIQKIDIEEERSEDPSERKAISVLKDKADSDSSITVTRAVPNNQTVSEENPIQMIVRVAPHSECIILVEKFDEAAAIELSSCIALTYPTYALLDESKFQPKKTRVKYNNKLVEIYECTIEHNSGVLFKYKNKTKDLKFNAHVIFDDTENLKLSLKPEYINEDGSIRDSYASYDPSNSNYQIDDPEREVVLSLEPGETKIFELTAINIFESFSYGCHLEYNINLWKNKV